MKENKCQIKIRYIFISELKTKKENQKEMALTQI